MSPTAHGMIVWLPKGTPMNKIIFTAALALSLSFSTLAWSETKTFQLSVIVPVHSSLAIAQAQARGAVTETTPNIHVQQLVKDNRVVTVQSVVAL